VRDGTYFAGRGPLPRNIERYSVGSFGDFVCVCCGALFFREELRDPTKNPFTCCEHGKVDLPAPRAYPEQLYLLKESCLKSLRVLNSKVCLAAYKAQRVNLPGFPWIYKIQGHVHVELDHADPLPDPNNVRATDPSLHNPRNLQDIHRRQNAQLVAFVDPSISTTEILYGVGGNHVPPELLTAYLEFLREHNPLYEMCVRMDLVLTEQQARNEEAAVTLVFKNPHQDKVTLKEHTHRAPVASNEIAALFDVSGSPLTPALYIMKEGRPMQVFPTHPSRDAFIYPVINPWGEPGWHPKMPHSGPRRTKIRSNVTMREYVK
jgi:hypothetical protein